MILPTQDKELQAILEEAILEYAQYETPPSKLIDRILSKMDKLGYHKGLPTSIEETLNSGDGAYRP